MSSSTNMTQTNLPLGAYGLRISGIRGADSVLGRRRPTGRRSRSPSRSAELDADGELRRRRPCARIRLRTGGWIDLDRDPGRARVRRAGAAVSRRARPSVPGTGWRRSFATLARPGETPRRRRSRSADTAWGIVGDRLGGKSSLLAALAVEGTDIVCDDVLVVDGRDVVPGPRTVDLREDAAAALERRRGDRSSRERESAGGCRLGALDRPLTLGGWVFTEWSDELEHEASAGVGDADRGSSAIAASACRPAIRPRSFSSPRCRPGSFDARARGRRCPPRSNWCSACSPDA